MYNLYCVDKDGKHHLISSIVYDSLPIGTELSGEFVNLPDGFLWAGTTVKGSDYPLLAKAYGKEISESFIVGNNLAGRTVVGVDTAMEEFKEVGKVGGEKTHTLSVAEMPNHYHRNRDMTYNPQGGTVKKRKAVLAEDTTLTGFDEVFELATAGGDQSHNNLQPYVVKQFIVKAYNVIPVDSAKIIDTHEGESSLSAMSQRATKELIDLKHHETAEFESSKYKIFKIKTQAELDNLINTKIEEFDNYTHYHFSLSVNSSGLTLGGGVWLCEGYKVDNEYGWQYFRVYSDTTPIERKRSKYAGVWKPFI